MKRLLLIAVLVALSGCATTANYEKTLKSWVGASELDLVRSWGPPQSTHTTGGRTFLVYSSARSVLMPGVQPTYTANTYGNTTYVNSHGGMPAQNLNFQCQTTFEVSNEKIVGWSWRGNDCRR